MSGVLLLLGVVLFWAGVGVSEEPKLTSRGELVGWGLMLLGGLLGVCGIATVPAGWWLG